jgi:hypothetical protein
LLTLCIRTDKEISESGSIVGDTTFTRGKTAVFTAMKVPRTYRLVFLVKVGWRRGKILVCEEGQDERWNRKRS